MCPDKKLKWFKERGWTTEAIEEVRQLVLRRWEESYKPTAIMVPAPVATLNVPVVVCFPFSTPCF
jgi:hypothetical protein